MKVKPWTSQHILQRQSLGSTCVISLLRNVPKQNERHFVWGQHLLQIVYVLHVLTHMSCSFSMQNSWICTFSKLLACSNQFSSVLLFDLKCIANELKATLVVLQGKQPRHSNSSPSNLCYWHLITKRTQQRNKGMAERHTKSLVSILSINLGKIIGT